MDVHGLPLTKAESLAFRSSGYAARLATCLWHSIGCLGRAISRVVDGLRTDKTPLDRLDPGDVRVVGPTARISPNIPSENPLVSDSLSLLDHFDDTLIPGLVPMIQLETHDKTACPPIRLDALPEDLLPEIAIDAPKNSLDLISGLRIDPYLPERPHLCSLSGGHYPEVSLSLDSG
jgi:hypothetical protein